MRFPPIAISHPIRIPTHALIARTSCARGCPADALGVLLLYTIVAETFRPTCLSPYRRPGSRNGSSSSCRISYRERINGLLGVPGRALLLEATIASKKSARLCTKLGGEPSPGVSGRSIGRLRIPTTMRSASRCLGSKECRVPDPIHLHCGRSQRARAESTNDGTRLPDTIRSNLGMNPVLRRCFSRTVWTTTCQSLTRPARS